MKALFKITRFLKRYHTHIAWLAIASSLLTWGLDFTHVVFQCPYCRVQRTVIGLLGLIALLPQHKNTVLRYSCYLIAFLGADISGDQIFLHVKHGTYLSFSLVLAVGAFVLIGVLTVINHYRFLK